MTRFPREAGPRRIALTGSVGTAATPRSPIAEHFTTQTFITVAGVAKVRGHLGEYEVVVESGGVTARREVVLGREGVEVVIE